MSTLYMMVRYSWHMVQYEHHTQQQYSLESPSHCSPVPSRWYFAVMFFRTVHPSHPMSRIAGSHPTQIRPASEMATMVQSINDSTTHRSTKNAKPITKQLPSMPTLP